jgi:hypothetical protein
LLTPALFLVLSCDGCGTGADDEDGSGFVFADAAAARDLFALDPHAAPGDDPYRWHFGADGTHLCPTCQCTAFGHVHPADLPGPAGPIDGPGRAPLPICLRCCRWLDLIPAHQADAVDGATTGRRAGR